MDTLVIIFIVIFIIILIYLYYEITSYIFVQKIDKKGKMDKIDIYNIISRKNNKNESEETEENEEIEEIDEMEENNENEENEEIDEMEENQIIEENEESEESEESEENKEIEENQSIEETEENDEIKYNNENIYDFSIISNQYQNRVETRLIKLISKNGNLYFYTWKNSCFSKQLKLDCNVTVIHCQITTKMQVQNVMTCQVKKVAELEKLIIYRLKINDRKVSTTISMNSSDLTTTTLNNINISRVKITHKDYNDLISYIKTKL